MLGKPDPDGRYPMSGREFSAYRCLIVAVNELDVCIDALKDRLKLIPGGWRDMRMLSTVSYKLFNALAETIPSRKLRAIQAEIQNCEIRLVVRGADRSMLKSVVYIDEQPFIRLMNHVISQECWCCEKCGKEAKKCEIRQLVTDVLHYDSSDGELRKDDMCELAGHTSIILEEESTE